MDGRGRSLQLLRNLNGSLRRVPFRVAKRSNFELLDCHADRGSARNDSGDIIVILFAAHDVNGGGFEGGGDNRTFAYS